MGRERENEKKFTKYLERILAGGVIKADPAMDEELRAALEFARKISALGEKPSVKFQERLKAQLLEKIRSREAQQARKKESRGSFWDAFRSHPAWQGAVAAVVVIILLGIIWRAGFFQFDLTAPAATPLATTATKMPVAATTAAPEAQKLVSIDAKTDKSTYGRGETVKIEVSMKNTSGGLLTITDFPPILSLMEAVTRQAVYTFTAGKETRTLAPNGVATYTYTWNQTDFQGQPVSGSYYVELEDLMHEGQPLPLNLNNPVKFEITNSPGK
jgi:hypothetical protein